MEDLNDDEMALLSLLFEERLPRTDIPQLAVALRRDPHSMAEVLERLESLGLLALGHGYWIVQLTDKARWFLAEEAWKTHRQTP